LSASLIIDCSITMTWCFTDEATPKTTKLLDQLADETALVPSLWFLEVTNVLAIAEKHKRITPAQTSEFLGVLDKLDIEIDGDSAGRAFVHYLPLCRKHKLTSYDVAYLDLAVRRGLPLATLDDDLRRSAKDLGIALLGK
jgi:predicted nucleic acid-binding protein